MMRVAGIPSMPKLYISPGLSERVHLALTRRLENFMAMASGSAMPNEMNATENPPLPGAEAIGESGSEHGEHGHQEDQSKSPVMESKEDEERGRSRSPRHKLNVPEPNPESPLEVLSACTSLAVGVTSMVAALKTSSEKLEVLISNTQSLQNDLVRSMEAIATSITSMSRSVESLSGGVSYNASRTGALSGEFQKMRKHLEWSMDRSLSDIAKEASKKRAEDASQMTTILEQMFEAMDRFQENIKEVARRMEAVGTSATPAPVQESEFGPPMPPTGHVGTPITPGAPIPGSLPGGILPPPAAPPVAPPQPPVATFAGYSPAKVGEPPMTYPANLDVQFMKNPPFRVLDESTGSVRNVSPTRQLNPATGTAAYPPLGYVVLKNTNDYRRVYP